MPTLASTQAGTGLPLVFLHAFPLSREMWAPHRPFFSKHFQFISFDLPGFGGSKPLGDTSSMEGMADAVLQSLDSLGIKEPFVCAGLSMGGYVLLQLLKKAPERLRGVVLVSTRATADTAEARSRRFKMIERVNQEGLGSLSEIMLPSLLGASSFHGRPELVDQVRQWIRTGQLEGVLAALRGMAERPDLSHLLTSMPVPALVLNGAEDKATPLAEMTEMARQIAGAPFHSLPSAGHLLSLEQPDIFGDLVVRFLQRSVL
jgi:pimeloyl-ACP methyl ester carboxylesterase